MVLVIFLNRMNLKDFSSGNVTKSSTFVKIGKYDILFSYGEFFAFFDGERIWRLKCPRKTTMQHYNKWHDNRVVGDPVDENEMLHLLGGVFGNLIPPEPAPPPSPSVDVA